jgi:Spy/CpxP family protein refolding chaperone
MATAQTGPAAKREAMQERMPQGNCPWGMGPGMMGGGMGMMGGGMGMGPGMMGGGMGPGMMSGMGMMGGGMGMGPGMMGGGMGMMGMGPFGMLDLSDDQRAKLNKLQDEHRKKDWEIAGKIMDEQAKLRDLYDADTPDAKKIGTAYGAIARLQQQAVEANVELHNRMQAVLTKEQREQLKQWRRGMGPGMGPGPRGMMGR